MWHDAPQKNTRNKCISCAFKNSRMAINYQLQAAYNYNHSEGISYSSPYLILIKLQWIAVNNTYWYILICRLCISWYMMYILITLYILSCDMQILYFQKAHQVQGKTLCPVEAPPKSVGDNASNNTSAVSTGKPIFLVDGNRWFEAMLESCCDGSTFGAFHGSETSPLFVTLFLVMEMWN